MISLFIYKFFFLWYDFCLEVLRYKIKIDLKVIGKSSEHGIINILVMNFDILRVRRLGSVLANF